MQNDGRNKKKIPYDKLEYKNVLFSVPLTRWERYEISRQYFREGSPQEVFFERQDVKNGLQRNEEEYRREVMATLTRRSAGGDNARGNYINVLNEASQHYRLYDIKGLAPTLQSQSGMSSQKHPFVVASRGRNPNNPKSRKSGLKTEQMLEPNLNGVSNMLTSVEKDNYVFDGRVRKLMPIECERLMSWTDDWTRWGINEQGEKKEVSDSQRYKMCGNGVVSNVIREIVKNLII
jgi:site-specific DNA-cytosine methylase